MFQNWINAESYPVSQLCVNTFPDTKVTLITDGIYPFAMLIFLSHDAPINTNF
jgi:hypothetical protein